MQINDIANTLLPNLLDYPIANYDFIFIYLSFLFQEGRSVAFKYGCKFVETSVAINDKVDDLLAGILKQIRLSIEAARQKESQPSAESSGHGKNLKRNNSDALINEIKKKTSSGAGHNTISFRSNTLTRKLFRSSASEKTKDKLNSTVAEANKSSNKSTNNKNNSAPHSSFSFVKFFNTLFKKKSHQSHIQSVENLFTPPVAQTKYKKFEK